MANDSRACRAQCHANGGFAHAAGNARQEKARKIGANDEQDHANGTEKKDQPETRRADDLSFEGLKRPQKIQAFVGLPGNLRLDDIQFSECLLGSDTGFKTRHGVEIEFTDQALFVRFGTVQRAEKSQADCAVGASQPTRKSKGRRKDADDFVRDAVEDDLFPKRRGIALKAGTPEGVGKDDHVAAARLVLFGEECSAMRGQRSKHVEEIRRSTNAADDFGFARPG